jgi:hypothetical protein
MNRVPSHIRKFGILAVLCTGLAAFCAAEETKQWIIPLGGNAYLTKAR